MLIAADGTKSQIEQVGHLSHNSIEAMVDLTCPSSELPRGDAELNRPK